MEIPMLQELFPRAYQRYLALPLLGMIADGFCNWLRQQGYKQASLRDCIWALPHLDAVFRRRGRCSLSELTREDLASVLPTHSQDDRTVSGTVHALERYLDQGKMLPPPALPPSSTYPVLTDYRDFLEQVRGLTPETVEAHLRTISCFLGQIRIAPDAEPLGGLAPVDGSELEAFIVGLGQRHGRATLQHDVAHLRGFLRFASARGLLPPGLDSLIDTPRVYQLERIPRALPWESVCALLASIDRTSPMGLRDYAMLFLIATYGLRGSDILALTFDDIHWREGQIRLAQRKTGQPLVLPITDAVGDVVIQYLRRGRPEGPFRQLFLRVRAPLGPLQRTAVNDAFAGCVKRSGLKLPVTGVHCLRHYLPFLTMSC
jgi:integrase/recombinase XerD